jgi:hypothetical protein
MKALAGMGMLTDLLNNPIVIGIISIAVILVVILILVRMNNQYNKQIGYDRIGEGFA